MFEFARRFAARDAYDQILENTASVDDAIKSQFLDDPEAMAIGGENDPKIAEFIERIPEDDDADPVTNEDIKKITEGMGTYCDEQDSAITDKATSGDYNELNEEDYGVPMTSGIPDTSNLSLDDDYLNEELYSDESDSNITDRITSGDYNELNEG